MIAEVIIDIAHSEVDKVFDYVALPDTKKGQRVLVPFGNRNIEGYVINLKDKSKLENEKLKTIIKPLDNFIILTDELLKLSEYMQQKNHLKKVDTLRLFLPSGMRKGKVKELLKTVYVANLFKPKDELMLLVRKNAIQQINLIEFLENEKVYKSSDLIQKFGATAVNKLANLGILKKSNLKIYRKPQSNIKEDKKVILTDEQNFAIKEILCEPKINLLFGVTGSGKTEVYMHCIDSVVKSGKSAIMLVPEISLTPQILSVFKARFGDNVAILHSGLSVGERFDEWQRIRNGDAQIVIGARSAIFAPVTNLGLIIIDEEHDSSYKSESNPRFFTHNVAKFRGEYNKCPVVLGSATPSIDSFWRAKNKEYKLIKLTKRANNKQMPQIQIIDMCSEISFGNTGMFSRQLLSDLKECIEHKNQAIIFVNRRGFSSYIICRECGYIAKCEDCDASLVYHKEESELKCHFCGKRYKALTKCPNCGSEYIRMGAVGTERVVEELKRIFPNVKILRMDVDNTRSKNAHSKILEEFSSNAPSVLVGTQIIAKGHDFPNVTLVGIVDADMSLHFSDFRSVERTFQLVTQVAGRAGRADKFGKVVLQTYCPKHYVYKYAANYDYKSFFEKEINLRETTKFPPFAKIVRILISSEDENLAKNIGSKIYLPICQLEEKNKSDFLFCRAMKSPVAKIQRKFRFQILMRFKQSVADMLTDEIYKIVQKNTNPKANIFIEDNPSNLS